MIHWGINTLNHGSSLAIFKNGKLAHYEFSPEDMLPREMITQGLYRGTPSRIFWYERPWVKKTRQLYAGQYKTFMDMSVLPSAFLKRERLEWCPVRYTPHHGSHAAAGYYTSPFDDAAIVVLDAIGEWECASIWEARHGEIKKVWSKSYPHSLGLFYSAFTQLVGLVPIQQEHIFQEMSQNGDPDRYYDTILEYSGPMIEMKKNLHRGIHDWPHPIESLQDQCDIAAAVQKRFEDQIYGIMSKARRLVNSDNLVYMGGCAMNSKANKEIVEPMWKGIWSLPQPGDPSSSIGAVLYHTKDRELQWQWKPVKHIEIRT